MFCFLSPHLNSSTAVVVRTVGTDKDIVPYSNTVVVYGSLSLRHSFEKKKWMAPLCAPTYDTAANIAYRYIRSNTTTHPLGFPRVIFIGNPKPVCLYVWPIFAIPQCVTWLASTLITHKHSERKTRNQTSPMHKSAYY